MRQCIQHITFTLCFAALYIAAHAQIVSKGQFSSQLQAFPFGTENIDAPRDMMVDDRGFVWLLDQRSTYCVYSNGPKRVHDLPLNSSAQRWKGVNESGLLISTDDGTTTIPTGAWLYQPEQFIFTGEAAPKNIHLPDGRQVQLTDSASLTIGQGESMLVIPLVTDKHTNIFRLEPGNYGRILYDPRSGIWILGENGLMLVSNLKPTFETTDTPVPMGKVTQVIEDEVLNKRFIYSISHGILLEELNSGKLLKHFKTDKDGQSISGTKWYTVDGHHYFHGRSRIYTYNEASNDIEVVLDIRKNYVGTSTQLTINDFEYHPIANYFFISTDDNRLFVHDIEMAATVEHFVMPEGTFSGINLIYESVPIANAKALIMAEHGQFILDDIHGHIRPAQEDWPSLQFGPNFQSSGAMALGDSLIIVSSFADGLFIYNTQKDSIYKPYGPDMSEMLITDIYYDGKQHIYGSTRSGMAMYSIADNTLQMISSKHGLPLQNLYYRYMNSNRPGEMFLGLTDRYARFNSSSLQRSAAQQLYIEHLEVNGNRTMDPPYRALGSVVQLNYLENNIGLRLGAAPIATRPFSSMFIMLNDQLEQVTFHEDREMIRFHALAQGEHTIKIGFSRDGPFTELLHVTIAPPFWGRWWFVGLMVTAILGIVFLIFRLRVNHVRLEAEMQAEFNTRIAQLELSSLRAQMHPHFIFNSLNSIKSFIAENEPRTATRYLNKFSQLIRSILNNSQHARIELRSELHALKLYLELEQMRFEKSFDLTIDVDPKVDQDEMTIPPMILQPYAENAIWHGLMHKDGERRLSISISKEDDSLKAIIKDNGIGREAARALKSKSATKHRSLGMKITEEILQRTRSDGSSGVLVSDLVDDAGRACGTQVTITIPIQQK